MLCDGGAWLHVTVMGSKHKQFSLFSTESSSQGVQRTMFVVGGDG